MKSLLRKRGITRRRFLAVGSLTATGLWASCADSMGARAVRELVSDARRRITPAHQHPTPLEWNDNAITLAWIGHSTVLLNFYGVRILTDPVLFPRVGAATPVGTIGCKRLIAPALTANQLPEVDLVLLSHAHLDHLDRPSLQALRGHPQAVTARNTSDLLQGTAVRKASELGWGDETRVRTRSGEVHIRAFQVRHWGARWRYDTYRGYNGYVLEREGKKIIFGGDTALTNTFRALRTRGGIDLALMPIGAYHPWVSAHCTPEEAVWMADAAGARQFAPIHFRTFPLGREDRAEPLERLQQALEPERLAWREVGETCVTA